MRSTFRYELKKMLLVRGGIWLIALFFLCSAVLLVFADSPENEQAEYNKEVYLALLSEVEGEYTEKKADFLESETKSLARAQEEWDALYDSYYGGGISRETLQERLAELEPRLLRRQGFQVLYEQYLYVYENPENRYFLSTNGWSGLLSGESLDVLLAALLIVLVTPVFCYEYGSHMDSLAVTTKGGSRNIRDKLVLILLMATAVCAGYFGLRLWFYSAKYGLPHGDYPFQSLSCFGSSRKELSLWSAFFLSCALKWFGCVYFSVLIVVFCTAAKKYAQTVFPAAAALLLPYMGLGAAVYYKLPVPLPFLLGFGFLTGSEYSADYLTGEKTEIFCEIPPAELGITWGVSGALCIAGIFFVLFRHRNRWSGWIRKRKPRASFLILCCLSAAVLAGCSGGRDETPPVYFNLSSAETYEQEGFRCYYDGSERKFFYQEKNGTQGDAQEIAAGVPQPLNRDPTGILSSVDIRPCLFGVGTDVFYMRESTVSYVSRVGRFASTIQTIQIVGLDTESFKETLILEQNVSEGRSYLGVEVPAGDRWEFLKDCIGFFLNRDSIFVAGSDIRQIDRKNGRILVLPVPVYSNQNIAFDGKDIYYIGENSLLMRYDTSEKISEPVMEIAASDFRLAEQGIFYLNRRDQDKLYLLRPDGTTELFLK